MPLVTLRHGRPTAGAFTLLALITLLFIPATARPAAATPAFQLPWPTGQAHYIWEGANSYNCGDHVGRDLYAIDFQLASGNPVSAVAEGVAHRGWDAAGYGNFIWVDHGGGLVSLYAHLSSFAVPDGAGVAQGQTVGGAGSTGNSTRDPPALRPPRRRYQLEQRHRAVARADVWLHQVRPVRPLRWWPKPHARLQPTTWYR
jgi:murein DD-endopeptidase MepM/ murein hydrolase activator NlpD